MHRANELASRTNNPRTATQVLYSQLGTVDANAIMAQETMYRLGDTLNKEHDMLWPDEACMQIFREVEMLHRKFMQLHREHQTVINSVV